MRHHQGELVNRVDDIGINARLAKLEPYDPATLNVYVDETDPAGSDGWTYALKVAIPAQRELELKLIGRSPVKPWTKFVSGTQDEHGVWHFNEEVPKDFVIVQWREPSQPRTTPSVKM